MELARFLVKAKRNTYAGGGEEKRLEDGSRELVFEKDGFKYRDRYFGSNPFSGEEVVWHDGRVVWAMNYRGWVVSPDASPEEIYDFLKEALMKVEEAKPFRGPRMFRKGDLEYANRPVGSIEDFRGTEKIRSRSKRKDLYILFYHGGSVE
ncbi:MAG: XRE family transcriptional regulator [Candidatus Aenigmarchaeota archaeon]|nr:XRE family transcriptional regulator [Candidatus Aenigmarchaeota archaeon]